MSEDRNGVLALFARLRHAFPDLDVTFDVIDVVRVRDAKMVEHWNVVDALTLMQRLGAAPVPS